ncbi:hypothetical protein SAMN05216557_107139 [Sphingomonas carotinifaciens]|uniref:Uncharacterized protein n=1 Tax=Sphingomonas carotinifaciens TaxID=1166323 RepID=A0A1G7PYT6_9SPHN|nr:hypothetical protein SAMN05216557_107139 [Sphingomonas carotinifaciens]
MPATVTPIGVTIAMITVQIAACFQVSMFAAVAAVGIGSGSGKT